MTDEAKRTIEDLKDTSSFTGETGAFPDGKLRPDDEGELQFSISHRDGLVFVDFGKPVAWLGIPPRVAYDMALSLLRYANLAAREVQYTADGDLTTRTWPK